MIASNNSPTQTIALIQTTLAAGTLDDNAIQALLPAFRWKAGAKWTLSVFSASENAVRTVTLAVAATEPVTLEGGLSTEAYRAELTGGLQPVTFWVTTVAPYRLLKVAIAGTPIEMLRVK